MKEETVAKHKVVLVTGKELMISNDDLYRLEQKISRGTVDGAHKLDNGNYIMLHNLVAVIVNR